MERCVLYMIFNRLYSTWCGILIVSRVLGNALKLTTDTPFLGFLTKEEVTTCENLRILPERYLHIKSKLLTVVWSRPGVRVTKCESRKW